MTEMDSAGNVYGLLKQQTMPVLVRHAARKADYSLIDKDV